ncbi:MAG: MTH938/NDUFAF3 family protein, partial [Sandaracinobacter sp.]
LYRPALLLTAEAALSIPGLTLDTLEAAAIPDLSGAELLLLGSGPTLKRSARTFVEGLRARNIRIEPMDSAAAARTYNVLAAEERLVAALIL